MAPGRRSRNGNTSPSPSPGFEPETYSYLWTIDDYPRKYKRNKLFSPKFKGGSKNPHIWRLVMMPNLEVEREGSPCSSINLHLLKFGHGKASKSRSLQIKAQFTILDQKNQPFERCRNDIIEGKIRLGEMWGWDSFCYPGSIMNPDNGLLHDNKVRIKCEISLVGDLLNDPKVIPTLRNEASDGERLSLLQMKEEPSTEDEQEADASDDIEWSTTEEVAAPQNLEDHEQRPLTNCKDFRTSEGVFKRRRTSLKESPETVADASTQILEDEGPNLEGKTKNNSLDNVCDARLLEKARERNKLLGKLFQDSIDTDVTVKSATKMFRAHRSILKAMCPELFREESQAEIVDVSDFKEDIVKAMLEYIYEGDTELLRNADKIPELIQIAVKYSLNLLKEDCEAFIREKLSVETVLDFLFVANKTKLNDLTSHLIAFLRRNLEAVKLSASFQDLTRTPEVSLAWMMDLLVGAETA